MLDQVLQETELVQYRANGMDVEQFKRCQRVVCAGGGTSWLAFDFLLSYHLPLCLRLRVCCCRLYHALQAAGIDLGLVAITTAVAAGGRTGKASQRSPLAGVLTPLAEATMIAADERSTPT